MSKDNTIVVLVTKNQDNEKEYRVKEVQAVENITDAYNPKMFNTVAVRLLFKDCEVITDESDAWRQAFRLEKASGYVEYGIQRFDFSKFSFPKK